MMLRIAFACAYIVFGLVFLVSVPAVAENWPEFRGANRSGVATESKVPLNWNAAKNISWKVDLPGRGASSPVVWNDRVYLTCYSGYGMKEASPGDPKQLVRHLLCFDIATGQQIWKVDVSSTGRVPNYRGHITEYGYATATPAVDTDAVYVSFGTTGVLAFDHKGDELWRSPTGANQGTEGCTSSPVLFGDLVIVNADPQCYSMLGLNRRSGKEVWRKRISPDQKEDTCSTPLIIRGDNRAELICHLDCETTGDQPVGRFGALDPETGRELWTFQVVSGYPGTLTPSPIPIGKNVLVMGKFNKSLVRPGGTGDVTDSHLVWSKRESNGQATTPVYHDGHIYRAAPVGGFAECINAKTGERVYRSRLDPPPRTIFASPVIASGRVYYVSLDDGVYVVAAKPEFEQLALNVIADDETPFVGSPAINGDRLLIRSHKRLYCIGR